MIEVTVRDTENGDTETAVIPDNDYLIVATGHCTYGVQAYATGTHVITVKGRHS